MDKLKYETMRDMADGAGNWLERGNPEWAKVQAAIVQARALVDIAESLAKIAGNEGLVHIFEEKA